MAAQGRTFSQCVDDALREELKENDIKTLPLRLATRLRNELHREGYAVHRTADCVRPGPPPVGRPLEEVMAERKET